MTRPYSAKVFPYSLFVIRNSSLASLRGGLSEYFQRHGMQVLIVFVELWVISWVRYKYMDTPFMRAAFQIAVGGFIVFVAGIAIGSA